VVAGSARGGAGSETGVTTITFLFSCRMRDVKRAFPLQWPLVTKSPTRHRRHGT
jgi:hypothetical protein